jgi:hypothetical protein
LRNTALNDKTATFFYGSKKPVLSDQSRYIHTWQVSTGVYKHAHDTAQNVIRSHVALNVRNPARAETQGVRRDKAREDRPYWHTRFLGT